MPPITATVSNALGAPIARYSSTNAAMPSAGNTASPMIHDGSRTEPTSRT